MPKISGVDTNNFSKINGILKANISKVNGISGLFAASPTPTPTNTPTRTVTPTRTPTPSVTPSVTPSISVSPTRTPTVTPTVTPSISVSPTRTPTVTPSVTPSISVSPTRTPTVTPTVTPSITVSPTRTPTVTPTVTPTPSSSPPPCNTISVGMGNSDFALCYAPALVDLDINGTDLSNSTQIYQGNSSCSTPIGPVYVSDGTGNYYWNGSNLSPINCPPCYDQFWFYDPGNGSAICNMTAGNVAVSSNDMDITLSTVLYQSCATGNPAQNGYYAQGIGPGTPLYYWDGTTFGFAFDCP